MSTRDRTAAAGPDRGLLLVGHGSREPLGIEEFRETARLVAKMARGWAVEPCFLEFTQPTIAAGFETLAARGVRRVATVPLLLFSAGHAERDIPAAVAAVAAEHPRIVVGQSEHLGCHEALLALSDSRYLEALAERPPLPADETVLVVVGRGSRDAQATAEMRAFARLRHERTWVAQARTAFIAMADPPLDRVLDEVVACGCTRVVVQPHFLFAGVLLDRMRRVVDDYARRHPDRDWVMTRHLGPSELLAEAILDRAAVVLAP
jgi:sirohydrochlorin cobaltochelatase